MSNVRQVITEQFSQVLSESGVSDPAPHLKDDQVLLESGLDSMGFAILVTRLEEELGYDPFVIMERPVYPRTLGEFMSIYEENTGQPSSQ